MALYNKLALLAKIKTQSSDGVIQLKFLDYEGHSEHECYFSNHGAFFSIEAIKVLTAMLAITVTRTSKLSQFVIIQLLTCFDFSLMLSSTTLVSSLATPNSIIVVPFRKLVTV